VARRMLNVLLLVVLLCVLAQAQTDLSGKWSETTPSGLNAELDIKATATTLTGTFSVRARPMTITDGNVTKNTFTFVASLSGTPETIEGAVENDEMKAWLTRQGPERTAVLKRVK